METRETASPLEGAVRGVKAADGLAHALTSWWGVAGS